jgi:hypothetical protein
LEIDALRAIVQAGFQPLKPKTAEIALQAFAPLLPQAPDETGQSDSLHEELKKKLVEMGRMRIPGQGGHDSEIDPVSIPKLIRSRFRDEVGQGFRF